MDIIVLIVFGFERADSENSGIKFSKEQPLPISYSLPRMAFYGQKLVNKVFHFLYLANSNANKSTIDQFVEYTGALKSSEYIILEKEPKDQTVEKYDRKRTQKEDSIYQDPNENSDYKKAVQENSQNMHPNGKVQNYTSTDLIVPETYQILTNFFPQNQVNEPESGSKINSDHYAPLTKTEENSYEHLTKTDSQNQNQISLQLKPETRYEESGSTSLSNKNIKNLQF